MSRVFSFHTLVRVITLYVAFWYISWVLSTRSDDIRWRIIARWDWLAPVPHRRAARDKW